MNLFDEQRPRLGNGRSAFLSTPDIAVPELRIFPSEATSDGVLIGAMLGGLSGGRWYYTTVQQEALPIIISDYRYDPEGTILGLFAFTPSREARSRSAEPAASNAPQISAKDLLS
jgi:hypothetical protein